MNRWLKVAILIGWFFLSFLDGRIIEHSFLTQHECSEARATVERMRVQLAQLKSLLLDLQTTYTEEHPRIRIVKERIDELAHWLRQLESCPHVRPGRNLEVERAI